MRSFKLVLIGIFLSIGSSLLAESKGFDYTRAMVHLSRSGQHDSVGFNLVEELTELIYPRIKTGEIILWDSPAKKIRINQLVLIDIEKGSGTKFLNTQHLFIHEYWKMFKKDFEFNIVGFTFSSKGKGNQEVIYGFLDVNDVLTLLKGSIIPTNANGEAQITYWDALMSKQYNFNLVQFEDNNFERNPKASIKMVKKIFDNPKVNTNQVEFKGEKEVIYEVTRLENPSFDNNLLLNQLSAYFNNNKHDFYNLGGNLIHSHLNKDAEIHVTKLIVCETWSKTEQGILKYAFKWVDIYVDRQPIERIRSKDINQLDLSIKFMDFQDFLLAKSFLFSISSVNHESIPPEESSYILNALKLRPWNQITTSLNNQQ